MEEALASSEIDSSEAGFVERLKENQRRVFQIAYGVLGNRADAEEVAQEAFLRAYRKFHSLRDPEKFRAWVNRITFRLALNRQRGGEGERITENTLIRVAVDVLLGRAGRLRGTTEDELRKSVTS